MRSRWEAVQGYSGVCLFSLLAFVFFKRWCTGLPTIPAHTLHYSLLVNLALENNEDEWRYTLWEIWRMVFRKPRRGGGGSSAYRYTQGKHILCSWLLLKLGGEWLDGWMALPTGTYSNDE